MKFILLLLLSFNIFFLCYSQSPGGISSNLQMWVKSDAGLSSSGSNITGWTDQTAVNTFSVTGTPQLVAAGLNYHPTVQFDGSSRFSGNTSIANTTHAFAVGKIVNESGTFASGALIGNTTLASGDYFFHTEGGRLYAGNMANYTAYNTSNTLPFNIYSEDFGKTPAASDIIRINGANTVNNIGGDPVPYNRPPALGARVTQNMISGSELAEAIIYNTSISSTNVLKIESYLAIKYGIVLNNAGGGIAGDYTSSAGTIVWDASDGNAYHNQVIGIARDDNSGLLQKQSHSLDDITRIYLSTLQTTNAANGGSFSSDAQFIMAGNNQAYMHHTSGNTEYPAGLGIYSRIDREWKITNTGFAGTFSMDIKPKSGTVIPADIRILIDDDGNFANATMYNPAISFASGVITISGISTSMIPANSTRYLAIVSMGPSTPLPVELINFNASVADNQKVLLSWQTVTESNNDYFAIERSTSFVSWQEIGRASAAGNSSQLLSYTFTDNHPEDGDSYYRLKQTGIDGHFSYSAIKTVRLSLSVNQLKVYPNPVTDQLELQTGQNNLNKSLKIFDVIGRDMSGYIKITLISDTKVQADISKLPAGIYYIRTEKAAGKFLKQ